MCVYMFTYSTVILYYLFLLSVLDHYICVCLCVYTCTLKYCMTSKSNSWRQRNHDIWIPWKETDTQWEYSVDVAVSGSAVLSAYTSTISVLKSSVLLYFKICYTRVFTCMYACVCVCRKIFPWNHGNSCFFSQLLLLYFCSSIRKTEIEIWTAISNVKIIELVNH